MFPPTDGDVTSSSAGSQPDPLFHLNSSSPSPARLALGHPDFSRYAFARFAATLAWQMIDVVLEKPPETISRRLSSIRDAVQRLVQLIDRFLDSERRDLNFLQPERIDIAGLLDRVRKR